MPNENAKFLRFAEVVSKNAEAECKRIEKQTKNYKDSELSAITKQIEEETKNLLFYETGKINAKVNKQISDLKAESKKALMEHREKITNEVFEAVKEKLADFCESEQYDVFLQKSLDNTLSALALKKGERCAVLCRKRDFELLKNLTAELDFSGEIKISDDIAVGGIAVQKADGSLKLDDTLDTRLLKEKENFKARSGLKISE